MIVPILEIWGIDEVFPYHDRLERVNREILARLERSISEVGFTSVIAIDAFGSILAGTEVYVAAKRLGYTEVPVIVVRQPRRHDLSVDTWQCSGCGIEALELVKGGQKGVTR